MIGKQNKNDDKNKIVTIVEETVNKTVISKPLRTSVKSINQSFNFPSTLTESKLKGIFICYTSFV